MKDHAEESMGRIGPEGEAESRTGREEEAQRFRELKPFSRRAMGKQKGQNMGAGGRKSSE